ncbi:MAG: polysaccharide deacetylase family protein [Solirubrobacteraceae bacterium]
MPRPTASSPSLLPLIVGLAVLVVAVAVIGLHGGPKADPTTVGATTAISADGAPARATSPGGTVTRRAGSPAGRTTDNAGPATPGLPTNRGNDWPVAGADARAARVPILMYHLVADAPAGTAYPDLWVPPSRFRSQIEALQRAGFEAVTMGEVWDAWHGDGHLPRRPVVVSFDDGSLSQVMNAAPVLLKAGWPGVLNLTVQNLGNDGLPMWGARRMIRQGWEIGSHTVTHPDLTTLGADALRDELTRSRRMIRNRLGVDPRFLCYPAGRNDAAVRAAARDAGYRGATTVDTGRAGRGDDPFLLPRIRVQPSTGADELVRMARGA